MAHAQCTLDTDTHPEYVIIMAFPLQKLLLDRASMLRLHVHCLCLCDLRKMLSSSSKEYY